MNIIIGILFGSFGFVLGALFVAWIATAKEDEYTNEPLTPKE